MSILLFLVVLYFIWAFYCLIEFILNKIENKHYAQTHFERTERYYRGF